MATQKQKPKGYFEKVLALDCETTGLAYNSPDPSFDYSTNIEYQAISWGLIVANALTLKPIEKVYLEVKWNGVARWDEGAQKIHGLSKAHLEANGLDEAAALEEIGNLFLKHWGTTSVRTLGHNVATFDLWFMRRLASRHGIEFNFGNRHVDTSTVGFVNWGVYNSDDLFNVVGLDKRDKHNALTDAEMSLEAARITRVLFTKCIDGE